MASTHRPRPTATTAPKGRPTPPRNDVGRPRDTVTLQWVAVGVGLVAVVAVLVWVGRDWGVRPVHGGGHGAPGDVPAEMVGVGADGGPARTVGWAHPTAVDRLKRY